VDMNGKKIADPERIAEIKEAILESIGPGQG
jgi:hypothetical protein